MKRFVAFVMLGLALFAVPAAGAYFTAQAEVPDNIVRAGGLAISTEPTSALLCSETMAPGVTVERPLVVRNDGALPAEIVLTAAKKAGITEFYNTLHCRVTAGALTLYEGPLASMRTATATIAPAARNEYRVAVSLPATATNSLAGDYAKFSLYVDAEQTR